MEFELELEVTFQSDFPHPPVAGHVIRAHIDVRSNGGSAESSPEFRCSWHRQQISCSVHPSNLATVQCRSCSDLNLVEKSFFCSNECFMESWENHKYRHPLGASRTTTQITSGSGEALRQVGSSQSYCPTANDVGFTLRFECVAVDPKTTTKLSRPYSCVTDVTAPPHQPRLMNLVRGYPDAGAPESASDNFILNVLSYNILCPGSASTSHHHCPPWALDWKYRWRSLLREIIEYKADILCFQEVQSDYYEDFEDKLAKLGYTTVYMTKANPWYDGQKAVYLGSATCFRHGLFKVKKEQKIEFQEKAQPLVDKFGPDQQREAKGRLLKDNGALILILETLERDKIDKCNIIGVVNTHIFADPAYPDTKLFQVTELVQAIENITKGQMPLLLCGDLNSTPESDVHEFLTKGEISSVDESRTDPLNLYQRLKLRHSLRLESAYAALPSTGGDGLNPDTCEPLFTTYSPGFVGTLDYILYAANFMRVAGLLELLPSGGFGMYERKPEWPEGHVVDGSLKYLPSPEWPSDHIALMARFSLLPNSASSCSFPESPR